MSIKPFVDTSMQRKRNRYHIAMMALTAALILPSIAFADAGDAQDNICNVLNTINKLLSVASVIVVTIAIIFAGYQIAFAHKRISDVAPALIGGVLIGAAAQIAKMVIGGSDTSGKCAPTQVNGMTSMLIDHLHSATQILQHYA